MKQSIKKSLLSIMLLLSAKQALCSAEIPNLKATLVKGELINSKELSDIVKQSGAAQITFYRNDSPGSDNFLATKEISIYRNNKLTHKHKNVVCIAKKYATPQKIAEHASIILHEIGHLEHGHLEKLSLLSIVKSLSILSLSSLPILASPIFPSKHSVKYAAAISSFLITCQIELALRRRSEYQADTFMLQKSTKDQLLSALPFFESIKNKPEPVTFLGKTFTSAQIQFISRFTSATHPTTESRIQRIKDRIQELTEIEEEAKLMRARL